MQHAYLYSSRHHKWLQTTRGPGRRGEILIGREVQTVRGASCDWFVTILWL